MSNGGDTGTGEVYVAPMAFTISGDDPLQAVLDEVQRVYGVQVQVVGRSSGEGGGGREDEDTRTKQDRT